MLKQADYPSPEALVTDSSSDNSAGVRCHEPLSIHIRILSSLFFCMSYAYCPNFYEFVCIISLLWIESVVSKSQWWSTSESYNFSALSVPQLLFFFLIIYMLTRFRSLLSSLLLKRTQRKELIYSHKDNLGKNLILYPFVK